MTESDLVDPDECDETIHMECPDCGLDGDVPEAWKGLQIECKDCDHRFTVEEKQ